MSRGGLCARKYVTDNNVIVRSVTAVQPIVSATVRAQLSGVLFSINFTEGQMVKKGDLLVEIDPRPFQVQLEQAEGLLAKDEAARGQHSKPYSQWPESLPEFVPAPSRTSSCTFLAGCLWSTATIESLV